MAQIYLDGNILKSVRVSIGQTPCSLNIILLVFNLIYIFVLRALTLLVTRELSQFISTVRLYVYIKPVE